MFSVDLKISSRM